MKYKHIFIICTLLLLTGCSFTGNAIKEKDTTQTQAPMVLTCDQVESMYIKDIAEGFGVDPDLMLQELVKRFDLKRPYTPDQTLAVLMQEKQFMCTVLTDIAEGLRNNQTACPTK